MALAAPADEFTARMFGAINAMLLDMLAAVARKDYEDRRRRQAQGISKAKAEGAHRGRPEDTDRNAGIAAMLRAGSSYTGIQAAFGCSRTTSPRSPSEPHRLRLGSSFNSAARKWVGQKYSQTDACPIVPISIVLQRGLARIDGGLNQVVD
jgi:hypothetical protein